MVILKIVRPQRDYNTHIIPSYRADYFWSLSSGKIVVITRAEDDTVLLTVWNKTKLIHSERLSPQLNTLSLFLPEGVFLTQLKDKTFHLTKEQEFLYRALLLNPENFYERHKKFLYLNHGFISMSDLFSPHYLKNRCFFIEENIFAVPERIIGLSHQLFLNIYKQQQTQDGFTIQTLSTNNFLCNIPSMQNEVNCFTLDAHTLAITGNSSLFPLRRFTFKFDGKNIHVENQTTDYFDNNYGGFFPLNKNEVVLINKKERFRFWLGGLDDVIPNGKFSFQYLDKCESFSSTFVPQDLQLEWLSKTPQHYFAGNHNFLLYECSEDASPTTSAKSDLLIYNTFDHSAEVVDLAFNRSKMDVSPEGHVISIVNGHVQIAEFPKVTAWLKHLNKTLRNTLEEIFEEKALCNLVSDYVEKDIQPNRFYGNFFNTKNEINSQQTAAPRLG